MSKHLNPLEKEFLIRMYRSNQTVKMKDFCEKNNVSVGAFQKWIKRDTESTFLDWYNNICFQKLGKYNVNK